MDEKNIIVYVSALTRSVIESIRKFERENRQEYRILLIQDIAREKRKNTKTLEGVDFFVEANFSKPESIYSALMPYLDKLWAITAKTESAVTDLIKVIPNVPYLQTPTTESLKWASDKHFMRRRFHAYDKRITPKYSVIKENSTDERSRVIAKIGFPMVVKPANLSQSLLVTICHHEDELKGVLKKMFTKIQTLYSENKRSEIPKIIVEEFMDGLMYSVDVYVSARGKMTFCPLVRVKTGKEIGFDDFFGYLRITPTKLSKETVLLARDAARKGIKALGLRSTSAHVELMRIDNEWKVIEIGARIGGNRHKLHELACGINHNMNDILVRADQSPIVPLKCEKFAANIHWYAKSEGIIESIRGIKKINSLDSFVDIIVNKKSGDSHKFAKNGGKPIFNLTMANSNRSLLLADIRRVEQLVKVKIAAK